MGIYINNRPTTAQIGRVEMFNGDNNTTPSVITEQIRADRIRAARPNFSGTAQAGKSRNMLAYSGTLCHPVTKSEFTCQELCGAGIKAQHLDFLA